MMEDVASCLSPCTPSDVTLPRGREAAVAVRELAAARVDCCAGPASLGCCGCCAGGAGRQLPAELTGREKDLHSWEPAARAVDALRPLHPALVAVAPRGPMGGGNGGGGGGGGASSGRWARHAGPGGAQRLPVSVDAGQAQAGATDGKQVQVQVQGRSKEQEQGQKEEKEEEGIAASLQRSAMGRGSLADVQKARAREQGRTAGDRADLASAAVKAARGGLVPTRGCAVPLMLREVLLAGVFACLALGAALLAGYLIYHRVDVLALLLLLVVGLAGFAAGYHWLRVEVAALASLLPARKLRRHLRVAALARGEAAAPAAEAALRMCEEAAGAMREEAANAVAEAGAARTGGGDRRRLDVSSSSSSQGSGWNSQRWLGRTVDWRDEV